MLIQLRRSGVCGYQVFLALLILVSLQMVTSLAPVLVGGESRMNQHMPIAAFRARLCPCSSLRDQGFTLVELLVALALAGAVAAAAGSLLLAQMRLSTSVEISQRQRDDATRLSYLVQIESGEAASIEASPVLPSACGSGATSRVAFAIPRDTGDYLSLTNVSKVYYFNKDGHLWRCGPPIFRNGVINHDPTQSLQAGIAVRNASMNLVTCSGQATDSLQLAYQIVFSPSSYVPPCSVARAKTLLVCNIGETNCI